MLILNYDNLRSGILFLEEHESIATREYWWSGKGRKKNALFFLPFTNCRLSRCYTFALLRKRRPDSSLRIQPPLRAPIRLLRSEGRDERRTQQADRSAERRLYSQASLIAGYNYSFAGTLELASYVKVNQLLILNFFSNGMKPYHAI